MASKIEKLTSENDFLKTEIARFKNQIETDAYKVIFDSSPDIIIQLDRDNIIQIIHIPNISKERLDALIGKNIFDVSPLYVQEKMKGALKDVFNGGVVNYESEGDTLGEYRFYQSYVAPIYDETKQIVAAYFVSRDITIQKKAEKILLESERKLNTVYENSVQLLNILDLHRNFVWFNKNAYDYSTQIFGKPLLVGDNADVYTSIEAKELFLSNFNKAANGEIVIYQRDVIINNRNIYFEYALKPVTENGKVIGVSLSGIDITHHKEYEEYLKSINMELIRQNEQLNHYSHVISHNLRGPVATLMGLVKLFEHEKNNPQQVEVLMELVYKSALNFDTIIKDLTEVISYDEQNGSLLSKIDLKEECEVIEFLLSAQIHDSSAQIIYDFETCPTFHSIKSYVHSILYNLVSNGIKYKRTHVMPVIHISCYMENEKEVCIECADNGLGLDLDKYGNKLFGFYKRFHSHVEGKGLGLHLVKKQVDLLGGRIDVQSEINEGTTFKIFLPV
jgi:PAS domain S-box-containing protein